MKLVRFCLPGKEVKIGLWEEDRVYDLTSLNPDLFSSFLKVLDESYSTGASIEDIIRNEREKCHKELKSYSYHALDKPPSMSGASLLMPLDPPEVWGFGVTYLRSRAAREFETKAKGIYALVYEAERPEIFFKSTSSRCVGPNEPICIRSDSAWTVPEPELALILGRRCEIVGYTIGNDVSARDIEGENPLYLPQAKIYKGCCAIGPAIVLPEEIKNPKELDIKCRILRGDKKVFEGETNTSQIKRDLGGLLRHLCRDNPIPTGSVCFTGTGIVPPDDFKLRDGDFVEISIENIGTLRNPVKQL